VTSKEFGADERRTDQETARLGNYSYIIEVNIWAREYAPVEGERIDQCAFRTCERTCDRPVRIADQDRAGIRIRVVRQ
jgi:hypothetical protein